MKHVNLLFLLTVFHICGLTEAVFGQDVFIPETAVAAFKKKAHSVPPPYKSRYIFDVGPTTGREYLKQQDLFDTKGKLKSSGVFGEDGNKSGDLKYTYDPAGKLISQELKFIGKNEKEVTTFNASGQPEKVEHRTKGDTLIGYTLFVYNETGRIKEEHHYRGDRLTGKNIFEDSFSPKGQLLTTCHYELDSLGGKVSGSFPMTVNEYDDQGMILQRTVYNNKEKRKMLKWVYYKYQLDNDYRIIKQAGFNEEQQEICRAELTYTDSSITSTSFKVCVCPAKTLEKTGAVTVVYNSFGEKIREIQLGSDNAVVQTISWKYDDFGNMVEKQVVKAADPAKLVKSKTIFEYHSEQASTAKPAKK